MNVHGFEIDGDWKPANRGYTAIATRGGKKYFLKKYGDFKLPRDDGTTSTKGKERITREFNEFMDNRIAINLALKELAGPGGNIILPLEWFVDDICYVEATEWVSGLIEDEDILKLSMDEKKFVMLTAAGALNSVHRKNVVHSDLKRTNLLVARNSAGRAVGKLIDFDKSYFVNNVREDELGGDQSYLSPELGYTLMTDLSEEGIALLSTKSDIFSLGLIFHNYLADGDMPEYRDLPEHLAKRIEEEKAVYCFEALLTENGKLVISPKIKEEYLANLICAMIQPEAEDRPTALEVVAVLRDKTVLPIKEDSRILKSADSAKKAAPAKTAAKPTEKAIAKTTSTTPAKPEPTPAPVSIPEGFCEAWPEHGIALNVDTLRAVGYVAAEQVVQGTNKCYKLYKADGSSKIMMPSVMKLTGFVTEVKIAAEADDDGTLWPEDAGYVYNLTVLEKAGYAKVAKRVKNGKNMYAVIKATGEERLINFNSMKILGFVKKA